PESLGNEDCVFEVVTAPRHEGDQDVSSQSQLAAVGTRPVGDDLALRHALADVHNRALINTGVLVRTLVFDQRVDVGCHFARSAAHNIVFGFDGDSLRLFVIDQAVATLN